MAAANPHRTAVSATNVDLPMVARAVCQNRVAHVSVQIATRARVAPAGPRLRAPGAPGALLYLRHEGVVKLERHSRLKTKGFFFKNIFCEIMATHRNPRASLADTSVGEPTERNKSRQGSAIAAFAPE